MKIIAFGHRRRMGKDTAAQLLTKHLVSTRPGIRVECRGFATKLKEIAVDLYGWAGLKGETFYENQPNLKDCTLPIISKSPRQIWIELGMSMRGIWTDTWAKASITCMPSNLDLVIFKDLRFKNEAEIIKEVGGKCYRIINPREEQFNDSADSALDGWEGWEDTIMNDGSIRDLGRKIIKLYE